MYGGLLKRGYLIEGFPKPTIMGYSIYGSPHRISCISFHRGGRLLAESLSTFRIFSRYKARQKLKGGTWGDGTFHFANFYRIHKPCRWGELFCELEIYIVLPAPSTPNFPWPWKPLVLLLKMGSNPSSASHLSLK